MVKRAEHRVQRFNEGPIVRISYKIHLPVHVFILAVADAVQARIVKDPLVMLRK